MRNSTLRRLATLLSIVLILAFTSSAAFAGGPDRPGTPPEHDKYEVDDTWTSSDGCVTYHQVSRAIYHYNDSPQGYSLFTQAHGEGTSVNSCTGASVSYSFDDHYKLLRNENGIKEHGVTGSTSISSDGTQSSFKAIFRWNTQTNRYCIIHWWDGEMTWNDCYGG